MFISFTGLIEWALVLIAFGGLGMIGAWYLLKNIVKDQTEE